MEQTPAAETAAAVRAEMARRRVTGRQLATDLGWSRSHTSRRLNGEYPFDIDQLVAIADYLECPLADLVPGLRAA